MNELVFPAELFQKIFRVLQEENSYSEVVTILVACSRSCKFLSDLCRPFIFERVHIKNLEFHMERAISFVQVIQKHPEYLKYIRDLVIDLYSNAYSHVLTKYTESNPEALTQLHSVLISFSRLRSITIAAPAAYSLVDFKKIASDLFRIYLNQETLRTAYITGAGSVAANTILASPSLQALTLVGPITTAFETMMKSSADLPVSTVKELKITNAHEFPIGFLQLFPNTTSLEIHGNYTLSTRCKGAYPRPYLMLEYLSLSIYEGKSWRQLVQFFKDITGPGPRSRFPRLGHLKVHIGSEDVASQSSTFLEDLTQLRKLQIDVWFQMGRSYRDFFGLMNLSQHIRHTFPSLEHLSLSLFGSSGFDQFDVKLTEVHSLLAAIRVKNRIQQFRLTLNVSAKHHSRLSSDLWSNIGLILADGDDFAHLVEVHIFLIIVSQPPSSSQHQPRTWEEHQFEANLESAGRVLRGRDGLLVETSVKRGPE